MLIRNLVSVVARRKTKQLEKIINNYTEYSDNTLMNIMQFHSDTAIGKQFGFESIRTPEQFAENVPLMEFSDMKPYLEKVYENPAGKILTSDPVIWYVQTSGTSGKPKTLPLTGKGMSDYVKSTTASQMAFVSAEKDNKRMFDGKLVMFGAPAQFDTLNGIPMGYMSGIVSRLGASPLLKKFIISSDDIFNITDMDEKMRAYALLTTQADVTGFAGITTLSLSFFRRMQDHYGPWLSSHFKGTDTGRRVDNAIDEDGKLNLAELWPNMRELMATGIDTEPYRAWINKTLPNATIWEAYGGSEAYYATQIHLDDDMHFLPFNYFEFIPENEIDKPNPTVIPMSEVKKGGRYEIVLTTSGGWYRYRVGDVMTISNIEPFQVKTIGRKGRVVNLAGEKLSDAHVTEAMTHACSKTGVDVSDFTVVGEIKDGVPRYIIAALFGSDNVDAVDFVGAFEDYIRSKNQEFAFNRDLGALTPTILLRMRSSHAEKRSTELHIQTKPIPLTTDTSVLEICEEVAI